MSIKRSTLATAIAISLALSLSACGGGGGSRPSSGGGTSVSPTPTPTPAPSPSATVYTLPSVPAVPPTPTPIGAGPTTTDPLQYLTVGAQATNIPAALTGKGVTIGVVDTGVDTSTAQLQGADIVRVNCPICNDSNDVPTYGTVNTAYQDAIGHGTLVAEVIAGQPWTYQGQTLPGGLAPGAGIIVERAALDAGTDAGSLPEDAIANGAVDAFNNGAKIVNFSNGGGGVVGASTTSTNYAVYQPYFNQFKSITQAGGLLVFAAGNDGGANPEVSAALPTLLGDTSVLPNWIVATAIDPTTGKLASYANACGLTAAYCLATTGSSLSAAASTDPSVSVYPAGTTKNTALESEGTSVSTPVVSAVGALVWQKYPWMTGAQVGETLLGTATPMGTGVGDATYGWGLLNANAAVNGPQNLAWGTFDAQTDGGTYTFSNNMFGAGGLTKDGSGTLLLTGNNNYSGATTVNGGALEVDGVVRSNVGVNSGATLQGTGLVAGNVTVVGGTVVSGRTAAGVGAVNTGLSVVGAYTQDANSTLAVEVGSPLKTQSAAIAGSATVLGIASGYTPQGIETLLWAQNGLTGTFSSVTAGSGVLLSATPSYTANEANIDIGSISASSAVAAVAASSAHAVQTAAHVQTVLDAANPVAQSVLATNTATAGQVELLRGAGFVQQVPTAKLLAATVTSLSGEAHPTATALERTNMDSTNRAYADHLAGAASAAHADAPFGTAWAQVQDGGVRLTRSGYDSASSTGHGLVAGLDVAVASDWTVGAGLQSSQVDAGVVGVAGRDTIHDNGLSLYAQYAPTDSFYANARLSGGHLAYQIEHTDDLGAVAERAGATYSGQYGALDLESGYTFRPDPATTLTPVVQLHADRLHTNAFAETGVDAFGIAAPGQSTSETSGSLGLRAARSFTWFDQAWSFNAHALWTRLFTGYDPSLRAYYEGAPGAFFGVTGVGLPRSSWDTGVGLSARLGKAWTVGAGYDRVSGAGLRGHDMTATVSWTF